MFFQHLSRSSGLLESEKSGRSERAMNKQLLGLVLRGAESVHSQLPLQGAEISRPEAVDALFG